MGKVRELIAKASKDFELAEKHRRLREYVVATLLYNKAVEKVLKALFITRTRKNPPASASVDYLARRAGVPEEISMYVTSMKDGLDQLEANQFIDIESYRENGMERGSEQHALYMDGLARRLLDYVRLYA